MTPADVDTADQAGNRSRSAAPSASWPGDVVLALTMGDPSGIGPDIAIASWLQRHQREVPAFAYFADPEAVATRAGVLGVTLPTRIIDNPRQASNVFADALPVLPVALRSEAPPGSPDVANAGAIMSAIESAVAAAVAGDADAVVTNPIAKSVLYAAGFKHPGHTEYLGHLAAHYAPAEPHSPVMMLAGSDLRVVPLTIHIPLKDVPQRLSTDAILKTCRILDHSLKTDFGIASPRIAVCGLNPHAGEDGTIGTEDRDIIAPAIATLRKSGLNIVGPLPADTMFHTQARARYDAALAMYHDQALIPVKTLAFDTGVNITLGLPFVRTSPDHGTAFDIAGTGKASPDSLIAALHQASKIAQQRKKTQAADP